MLLLLAFASGKGGVAKTTSAIAIAAALHERGRRPVLVDLDSGFDATWSVGFDAGDAVLDVLEGRRTLTEAAVETGEGFRLLAGSPALVRLESRPVDELAARLRAIAADEWLVVDTAPGFAPVLTRAAIAAADAIIVPFVPEPNPERRARHVLDVAGALGVDPFIAPIAVMVDPRRTMTGAVLDQAREAGLAPLAEIPRTVAVPESANAARSVLAHAPRSAIAQSYREATDAILAALADR